MNEWDTTVVNAPAGTRFSRVVFASYGTPPMTGDPILGACHAENSAQVLTTLAIGRSSFSLSANNDVFGDPCVGTVKTLRAVLEVEVGEPIIPDTTTVGTTPDTMSDTTLSPVDDLRERISLQDIDCDVTYTAATRTVTLCEAFEEIMVAGFESDGNFGDTAKGTGSQIELPAKFIGPDRISILRLAVTSKPEGLDIATFRGEGVIQIGDGSTDVEGRISVSPAGTEAFNNAGYLNDMWVQFNSESKLFDIDQWDETKFAFLTLNGTVYDYYENVAPPKGWTEDQPIFWRAYAIDGFGFPRLVANGSISLGEEYGVMYSDPFFELITQTVEVIEESFEEYIARVESDPCFGIAPYLITDPVTPSGKSRVTLTVDRGCESPGGAFGLAVFGENAWWDTIYSFMYGEPLWNPPVFTRIVSTKYTSRLEAEIYLASGEYEIVFGDGLGAFGTHSYRVTAPGSEVACIYPGVNVDPVTKTGTLTNCVTGNRRVEVWATSVDSENPWEWNYEPVPFENGVLDFSEVTFDGPLDVEIEIDDAPDGEMIVCFQNCDRMTNPEIFTGNISLDTEGFSGTGKVTSTLGGCESDGWNGVDYYHRNSPTSWTWVQWMVQGPTSLPLNGEYYATSSCWEPEAGVDTRGATTFTLEGPMPNRPSNDDIQSATELTPDIGRAKFSTVAATSQRGEMGPYSS
ncbi:MAG: hypothetical protein ACKOQ1_00545, partial [Actinomycetota bacterium]